MFKIHAASTKICCVVGYAMQKLGFPPNRVVVEITNQCADIRKTLRRREKRLLERGASAQSDQAQ